MELWIRSQDKQTLIKAEHLDIYNAGIEDEEPCYVIEECGVDLGSYETLKRAIEVLDEIQNGIEENGLKEERYNMSNGCYETIFKKVYEMPKE